MNENRCGLRGCRGNSAPDFGSEFGRLLLLLVILGIQALQALAGNAKEDDLDVNYDESKVPAYTLPSPLVSVSGQRITTPSQWQNVRRPELLALFANELYGVVPEPASPLRISYEDGWNSPEYLQGQGLRRDVRIKFENEQGKAELPIILFIPGGQRGPVSALMMYSFEKTSSLGFLPNAERPGALRNGIPLGTIFAHGYALVVVPQDVLVSHNEVEFQRGIQPLFYHAGQSFPRANEWGVIATIAWSGMRVMDYLETDKDIDPRRVGLLGHSKCGKAALWTAAQDERFALVIAAQSGCAGAALWRRPFGENLEKMVTRFPYWLCRNASKYIGREDDLAVDQHELLALIAPRPLYVCSGAEDRWADPRGEYLGAYHAGEVYRLLGVEGLTVPDSPPLGQPRLSGKVGYHLREGGHSIEPYDWERFVEFLDGNLGPH